MSPTAHLLWAASPKSRPNLAQLVSEKFHDAIDIDDFPSPLYGFEVTGGIYMTEVLEPLIAAWPESRADLDRELDFLRAAAAYRGRSLSTIADDVRDLVSHWMRTKKILGIVAEIDPSVANFIVKPRWEDDRPS